MSPEIAAVLAGESRWCVLRADNADVLPTLPPKSVAHVITDPPYTNRTSRNARTANTGAAGSHSFITFDGVDGAEGSIISTSVRVADRWVVVFCALEQLGAYEAGAGDAWIRASGWWRDNPAPQFTGDRPGQRLEGIAIAHRPGRKRWNRGGECWAPKGNTANATGNHDRPDHPTPKPLWLMLECLEAFTDPDDVVLDPFAGSGTTGVACLRLGRRFIGIERDEKYARVATERLEAEVRGLSLRDARAGQTSIFDTLGAP